MYECLNQKCKHLFLFPAELTEKNMKYFVCPYCQSLDFSYYKEDFKVEFVEDAIQVSYVNVKRKIKEGYQPVSYYKDYAVMKKVKKE